MYLQNSKAVVQSKDTTIQELKEKIAYLEAEVCALGSPGKGAESQKTELYIDIERESFQRRLCPVCLLLRSEDLG